MPAKRKILITGSSGMLGIDLCQELSKDYEVYGIDNRSKPAVHRYFECDITDENGILSVISKVRPDIVIHTAAWTDVDGCELDEKKAYEINSEGTENVALACEENGSALVYLSTDFVFDGKKKSPYKETDEPAPISVYGDSKFVGEETIQRIWPKHFILRTSWLYGKHGRNFVDTIIENSKTEKELKVVDDQVGSPTYTIDLTKAIHRLIDKIIMTYNLQLTTCGIYHISNTGKVSWYEYAKTILALTGSKTKVLPISSAELNRPAKRPAMSVLDNLKFEKFTGHKMRGWKEALKEYLSC